MIHSKKSNTLMLAGNAPLNFPQMVKLSWGGGDKFFFEGSYIDPGSNFPPSRIMLTETVVKISKIEAQKTCEIFRFKQISVLPGKSLLH